jgi:PAS domain S-box-containing protein
MTAPSGNTSYDAHVANAPIGIFEVNQRGEYVDVNEAACEMVGYSRDELLDMSVADLAAEQDDAEGIPAFAELKETGEVRTDGRIRHRDGHTVDVILDAVEIEDGRLVAYVQDVSEQKEYEEALERTRDELRQIIDLIPDPIFVKNRDHEVLLSNEANAELLGTTQEDLEGKPEPGFFPDSDHYETLRQRDISVIESGESTTFEEAAPTTASEEHIFLTTRIPFETSKTGEAAVLGYARDITKLKEYEQELEQQRDNLELLNEVLRHDIRNDLQLVTAYTDLLVEECEDETLQEYVTTIQESADHGVELTEAAREKVNMMGSATQDSQRVDLRAVLENEVCEVQSAYPDAAVTYDTPIPAVDIEANDMIASVFRNLLKNAIQHNDKPVAAVDVSATERDDTVTIRFEDNGPGVPDDQKQAIFDKGDRGLESTGTGIGLYLVETLVTDYGGDVRVEDSDPDGSVFVVELPKTE